MLHWLGNQGELLGLLAAVFWTGSTLAFTAAGRRVGSLAVNITRILIAMVLLSIWYSLRSGHLVPVDATLHNWLWLLLSGFVGFFLGDLCLFRAYLVIGPRLSTLLMALAPPVAAIAGWIWLDERLTAIQLLGMFVTLCGVAWVVMERPSQEGKSRTHVPLYGLLLGFLGAAGQGVGLVLGKVGMQLPEAQQLTGLETFDPIAATLIRSYAGAAGFLALIFLRNRQGQVLHALRDKRGLICIMIGAVVGPTVGVALLLRSVQLIPSGVAQTLVATVPVMILPFLILIYKEKVSWRAGIGAVIAVSGVAILSVPAEMWTRAVTFLGF